MLSEKMYISILRELLCLRFGLHPIACPREDCMRPVIERLSKANQLACGLRYLQSRGVLHLDLKVHVTFLQLQTFQVASLVFHIMFFFFFL